MPIISLSQIQGGSSVPLVLGGALVGNPSGSVVAYCVNAGAITSDNPMRYPRSAGSFSKMRVCLGSMSMAVDVNVDLMKNGSVSGKGIVVQTTDSPNQKYQEVSNVILFNDGDDFDVRLSGSLDSSSGICQVSVSLE